MGAVKKKLNEIKAMIESLLPYPVTTKIKY